MKMFGDTGVSTRKQQEKQNAKSASPSKVNRIVASLMWTILFIFVVAIVTILILLGYRESWTGFGEAVQNIQVRPAKSVWDWLDLLIVPMFLALIAWLLNRAEQRRTQFLADRRAEVDRRIARDQLREAALQAYFDHIMQLLLTDQLHPIRENIKTGPIGEQHQRVAHAARGRTLSVLPGLDPTRKLRVLQLLAEIRLIQKDSWVIVLYDADFSGIKLLKNSVNLGNVDLSRVLLQGAVFDGVYLENVDFIDAQLQNVTFRKVDLKRASFINAKLDHAIFDHADCRGALFTGAAIRNASLLEADFSETTLEGLCKSGGRGWMAQIFLNPNWTALPSRGQTWREQYFGALISPVSTSDEQTLRMPCL
jgi:pentapeptide repeat protein